MKCEQISPSSVLVQNVKGLDSEKKINGNGVARTLKSYAHQRETTRSSSDSLQLRPFSKWNFSKRKEFAPRGSEFFPLKAVLYGIYLIR